jgi:hypothetical protein
MTPIPVDVQVITHATANMSCQRGTYRVVVVVMRLRKSETIALFSLN